MKKLYFSLFFIFILFSGMFATPLRIIGMGSLDLIVEDESNRINLFDYGRNVAGLYNDERESSIKSYITYGKIKYSDTSGTTGPEISYWGINLPDYFSPPIDIENTMKTLAFLEGIPTGGIVTFRTEGGFAFCGMGAYSSKKIKLETFVIDASSPIGCLIISKKFGMYSVGLSGGYTKLTFRDNNDNFETWQTLKSIKGGIAVCLSPLLEIGFSGGYAFPERGFKIVASEFEDLYQGNAYSGGVQVIAKVPGLLKFGTKIDFLRTDLDEKIIEGGVSLESGEVSETDFNFGSRLLFSSILFPLKAGVNYNYRRIHSIYNTIFISDFDSSSSVTDFGLGVSYAMPLFTPGIQYNLYNKTSTDNLDNGESTNSNKWDVRFGGEIPLTIITLRAGYVIAKEDPDTNRENDESKSRSITLGAGIQFPLQPFKIEVAYVNKETQPVDNPDDSKETENSIYAALKLRF